MKKWNEFAGTIISQLDQNDCSHALLLALKHKYYRVYVHSLHVAYASYYLAKMLDLPDHECNVIALGALFHDIGKMNVSPKILYKPSSLNNYEQMVINRHPLYGVNLLASSKYLGALQNIILYHHERFDGRGYTQGLRAQMIPCYARMVSICDSFDAMIFFRSYKKPLSLFQASEELLKNKNTQFDGTYVDRFMEIIDEIYYVFKEHDDAGQYDSPEKEVEQLPEWRDIADQLSDIGIMFLDHDEVIRYSNKQAAMSRGRDRGEIVNQSFYFLHKPHRVPVLKNKFAKMHAGVSDGWSRLMANQGRYIQNKYISVKDRNSQHIGTVLITSDVTERENVLRGLERTVEKLNIVVQAANLLTDVNNLDQIFEHMQYLLQRLWIVSRIKLNFYQYKNRYDFQMDSNGTEDNGFFRDIFEEFFKGNIVDTRYTLLEQTLLIRRLMQFKNDNACIIEIWLDNDGDISDDEKQLLEAIFNYLHIAIENHLLFADIEKMAIIDQMTGLYNRRYLEKIKFDALLNKTPIFIMGDVNNLKYYNDKYGHLTGDTLICGAANIMKKVIHNSGLVFRVGGDEFLIILTEAEEKDAIHLINVIKRKAQLWQQAHSPIKMSLSFGYAVADDQTTMDEVIALADKNMYADKKSFKEQHYIN